MQLALWCDGSHETRDNGGGFAVVHNRLKKGSPKEQGHVGRGWPATPTPSSTFTEALALAQGIVQAMDELKKLEENLPSPPNRGAKICVRIFSDCRGLLSSVRTSKFAASYQSAGKAIVEKSEEFRQNFRNLFGRPDVIVDLAVHWVLGHDKSLKLHVQADKLAGEAREVGKAVLQINGQRRS